MKRIISVLLFIVLVVNSTIPVMAVRRSIGSSAFFPYMTQSEGGQSSTNLQNFYNSFNVIDESVFYVYNDISAEPIYSYLVENETSGYSRIEAIGEKVYVEEYSEDFEYVSAKEIGMEPAGCPFHLWSKYPVSFFIRQSSYDRSEWFSLYSHLPYHV